ncbi:MAG: hypothetical protein VX313_01675, partial [Bacteroidota bacterium]|nr:hypothetical protein [Bacteroidota bacterium]
VNWLLDDFLCYFFDYHHGIEDSEEDRNEQIAFFGLTNLFFEDLPQACLQIYIIFHTKDAEITWTQGLSIFSSLFSAAKTLVTRGNLFIAKKFLLDIKDETKSKDVTYEKKQSEKPRLVVEFRTDHRSIKKFNRKSYKPKYKRRMGEKQKAKVSFSHKIRKMLENNTIQKLAATCVPTVGIFLNIFFAICGAAYLSECSQDSQSRLIYAAFPVMIILRIAFPTDFFVRKIFALGKTKSTFLVSLFMLCLPLFIHAGLASRSDTCFVFRFEKVHFHNQTCHWTNSFYCFMVMSGADSSVITIFVGSMLVAFWMWAFVHMKKICNSEKGKHYAKCDCKSEDIHKGVQNLINGLLDANANA